MILSPEDLAQLDVAIRLAFQPRELERTLKFRLGRNLADLSLANNFWDIVRCKTT